MEKRDWPLFVYGGFSSCIAELSTFPIDTTKTRLQIQGQILDGQYNKIKYRGMIDAFCQIYKQEGFLSLYSGISPALLRQCIYGSIKFGTYYSLKKTCNDYLHMTEDTVLVNFACAICSGIISASIANPTDVLKVRLQALGREKVGTYVQNNIFKCFRHIYVHEGLRGLWKGVGPTSQRAGIIASVELPVYDYCKHKLMVIFGNNISNHFISSLIASFFSAVASNPIDVIREKIMYIRGVIKKYLDCVNNIYINLENETPIMSFDKTRLMNQNQSKYSEIGIYKGSIDCLLKTVKYEGIFSLYKGFVPTFVRMGPWNIIFFIIYERLKTI